MKEILVKHYQCEICKKIYSCKEDALECESKPISHDKNVKVGDTIKITKGEGCNKLAIVTEIIIYSKDHPFKRWHTPSIVVKLINSSLCRQLDFDAYEI